MLMTTKPLSSALRFKSSTTSSFSPLSHPAYLKSKANNQQPSPPSFY